MGNRRLIEKEWNRFSSIIGLEHVGDVQRTEMRRAFYAGSVLASADDGHGELQLFHDWTVRITHPSIGHIEADFSTNPKVLRRFLKEALAELGEG